MCDGDGHNHTEAEREHNHFLDVVGSFVQYETMNMKPQLRHMTVYCTMPQHYRDSLPDFEAKLEQTKERIHTNGVFLMEMASQTHVFEHSDQPEDETFNMLATRRIGGINHDKVPSLLKLFVRDWAVEGAGERAACYGPLLAGLEGYLPYSAGGGGPAPRVLVPGAGIGRLAWECAHRGYAVQGNEFSYHCLIASSFMLNSRLGVGSRRIFPFVTQLSNVRRVEDQHRVVRVPDVSTEDIPPGTDFSMAAGDFLEIYSTPGEWACVMTCFFIDTAKNVLQYIEQISNILAPDGVWLNLGPLLYHYADSPSELSIELTYEEIKKAMASFGLVVVEEQWLSSGYTGNERSMMHLTYNCVYFAARHTAFVDGTTPVDRNLDQNRTNEQ